MWNRPRPSTINRTSSSSCQCSLLNFLSIASRFGVSGFTSMTSAVTYPPRALSSSTLVAYAASSASAGVSAVLGGVGAHRSYSMPRSARYVRTATASSMVRFSSGIFTSAMPHLLRPESGHPPHGLEQKLEHLDVPLRLVERGSPSVQPVTPQQKGVRARVPL